VTPRRLEITALPGIPLVKPGDDLAALIVTALDRAEIALRAGDALVVAQKVVSKAEGRYAALVEVDPRAQALDLAQKTGKDARIVELILRESVRVVRHRPNLLIVQHKNGYVLANAGIDASNVEPDPALGERVLLLPEDPDKSCAALRESLRTATGVAPTVIINDSLGRAWRRGTVGTAIGAAGLTALLDLRGQTDLFGRELLVSQVGLADELAAAASLVQGEAAEGTPVAHIRGLAPEQTDQRAAELIRDAEEDLFR
jgi:coenzyme F420-0:L-glutamate ligase / coenzyme F420-1:gamma-L-glutamate ligase